MSLLYIFQSYSSHTSHHPSQTPCLPWISYSTQKLMLDSCKMLQKQSEASHTFLWHFFIWEFKIVVDSWKLLYILWDDWTIFYDFNFKWTATAATGIHHTKAWLSQLVNFKNAIWTWRHFRRTICNKIMFLLEKKPQKRMECFRLLLNPLVWIEHQFLSNIRDSKKAMRVWGMMRGVEEVRKSEHQSW